jgi:hypothetical protein
MTLPIVERLRFRPQVWSGGRIVAESAEYLNPDGPEAAKLIEELVEALRAATAQLMLIPNSAASEARRVAVIDCASALLAKLDGDS